MRFTACLAATLLFAANASAHQGTASAQGPTEEFATAQAMRLVPKGATITDTSCTSIDVGFESRYKCTLTYDDTSKD